MKKLLIGLVTLLALCVSGCNYKIADFVYSFNKVHVFETNKCYELENWRDYEDGDQIQVNIKGYGYCLFHANQIALIKDKCPFCD